MAQVYSEKVVGMDEDIKTVDCECTHNNCGTYHYQNGTCMNKLNEAKHFEECEQDECKYKELPILPDTNTSES
jgi:hypothetical protein